MKLKRLLIPRSGTSGLLLVAGSSGIGKTAVINEVHKPAHCPAAYLHPDSTGQTDYKWILASIIANNLKN